MKTCKSGGSALLGESFALLSSDSASFRENYVVELLASADKFLIKRPGIVNDPGLTSQPSVSKSM